MKILFSFFLSVSAFAYTPHPQSMAVFGDSISSAALADTTIPSNFLDYLAFLIYPQRSPMRADEIAIERFSKTVLLMVERPWLSWATGSMSVVKSHKRRIEHVIGNSMDVGNFSVSGFKMLDVKTDELPKLEEWEKKHGSPDYAILFAGPNDICSANTLDEMTSVEDFSASAEAVISRASRGLNTRLLVVPLLSIDQLYFIASHELYFGNLTCLDVWRAGNICPLVTLGNSGSRAAVHMRLHEYNETLRVLVNKYNQWDRIRLAAGVEEEPFESLDLAADCFHPSIVGQRHVSDLTWKSTWWAD